MGNEPVSIDSLITAQIADYQGRLKYMSAQRVIGDYKRLIGKCSTPAEIGRCYNSLLLPYYRSLSVCSDNFYKMSAFMTDEKKRVSVMIENWEIKNKMLALLEDERERLSIPHYPAFNEFATELDAMLVGKVKGIIGSNCRPYDKACKLMELSESYLDELVIRSKQLEIDGNEFNTMVSLLVKAEKIQEVYLYDCIVNLKESEKIALCEMEAAHRERREEAVKAVKSRMSRIVVSGQRDDKNAHGHNHHGGGGRREKPRADAEKERKAIAIKIDADGRQAM